MLAVLNIMSDEIRIKVEVYSKLLANIITSASLHYDIWWIYKERDSRAKYVNTMNQYLDFFLPSLQSHFLSAIVEIYKLFETRKDTANFPALVKLIIDNSLVKKDTQDEIQKKLKEARILWRKIAILRSELFAHSSIKLTYRAIFEKANVKPNEIKELIERSKNLLNLITEPTISRSHLFTLTATDDAKQVLEDLMKYNQELTANKRINAD